MEQNGIQKKGKKKSPRGSRPSGKVKDDLSIAPLNLGKLKLKRDLEATGGLNITPRRFRSAISGEERVDEFGSPSLSRKVTFIDGDSPMNVMNRNSEGFKTIPEVPLCLDPEYSEDKTDKSVFKVPNSNLKKIKEQPTPKSPKTARAKSKESPRGIESPRGDSSLNSPRTLMSLMRFQVSFESSTCFTYTL